MTSTRGPYSKNRHRIWGAVICYLGHPEPRAHGLKAEVCEAFEVARSSFSSALMRELKTDPRKLEQTIAIAQSTHKALVQFSRTIPQNKKPRQRKNETSHA